MERSRFMVYYRNYLSNVFRSRLFVKRLRDNFFKGNFEFVLVVSVFF